MAHCHTIATHHRGHFDEVVARVLLQAYGEELFPGASTAKLVRWNNGDTPDGRPANAWEAEGTIPIGVGHGRFDEHLPGGGRIPGECTATLVAKALGIENHPDLRRLLAFTLKTDEGPAQHPFDISAVLKAMHKHDPDHPEIGEEWAVEAIGATINPAKDARRVPLVPLLRVLGIRNPPCDKLVRFAERADALLESGSSVEHPFDLTAIASKLPADRATEWLTKALIALRDGQHAFHATAVEFAREAVTRDVPRGSARYPMRIVALVSANEQIAAFARSHDGCDAAVVIQRHPQSGLTQIFSDHRRVSQAIADRIAKSVIAREEAAGGDEDQWYYHVPARAVLNGSVTHPEVRPTALSLETITEIVIDAVAT